ncbi:MAG: hypothetical protein Q8R18_06515 [bacterium]|nr:hypothetical protein [bacterium]
MKGKKAQSAVEVSVLIFLIAVAMVGYIILLPQEDRAELLGESTVGGSSSSDGSSGTTLLSESPGKVSSTKSTTQIRSLEPIRLYSTTKSTSKSLASSLSVSRNILQNNYKTINFDIENLEAIEGLELLFLISESKGEMTVTLNEEIVYEGKLTSNELPLELPLDALQAEDNELKLSTNLAWNIFSPNFYLLQDIQLLQDYTVADISATRTLSIEDPSEVNTAVLNYFITCNTDENGILTISLNSREIFSDRIFCNYLNERELSIDEDYLQTSNTLKFEITEGDYNIEELDVSIKSKNKDYPRFTFDIDSDLYNEILAGDKDVYLKMSFDDAISEKSGTILIQEYSFNFDTESNSYEKKISSYIDDGANTITLEPTADYEIDNLKVYVK